MKIMEDGIIIGEPINVADDDPDTATLAVKIMKDLYRLLGLCVLIVILTGKTGICQFSYPSDM